ncbi:hypothetical protein [Sulfitobacter sp. W074]|uniref:hypothetical protein n=1 Tax=Sulfitobacter sp. W074 TaxID=2867026 RepID=UPI0021A4D7E6|nr:hypothetical protein [Sulfitobacter sp. W074]UWR36163.1 hypothetical protein K3762_10100 [Sulfitobacter sp. W074]
MSRQLNTTELANELNLSKGRISQLVRDGRLDGCFKGDGRARRFDLVSAAEKLGQRLDPAQMLGNGAKTRRSLDEIEDTSDDDAGKPPRDGEGATLLSAKDPSRYELARTQELEERARRARRQNESEEGNWVLASEVHSETARQIQMEIASIESSVLRGGARRIADELGVDFKEARAILTQVWREYRGQRSEQKTAEADAATLSPSEDEVDF